MIPILRARHLPSVVTTVLLLSSPYLLAQESTESQPPTTDDCVLELKTWPSRVEPESHPVLINGINATNALDSIQGITTTYRPDLRFQLVQIPGIEASNDFSACISSILGAPPYPYGYTPNRMKYKQYFTNDRRDFLRLTGAPEVYLHNDFATTDWSAYPRLRYFFTDNYQRKYLFDFKDNIAYEMKRIAPDNSIEALGHWDGVYIEDERISGCRNSYGDRCGTLYERVQLDGPPFYAPVQK